MSLPLFMSPEHVDEMNRLLAADEASRQHCAAFDRTYLIGYELTRGDQIVWWTMTFDPVRGVRFGLNKPAAAPDLLFHGDYAAFVEFTRLSKLGQSSAFPLAFSGDAGVYAKISAAFAAAAQAATIETRFE